MSILIKGMKMPSSCHECVAGFGMSCFVCPPEEDGECPDKGRPSWCPLIEVPLHGDLIDRDALIEEWDNGLMDDAPTIIEAEAKK